MRNSLKASFIALLCLFAVSSVALAQRGRPATPSNKPFDPKDYSGGPWSPNNSGENLMKTEPPMKPAALAKYKSEKTEYSIPPVGNQENTDPLNRCEPGSAPRFYFNGHPVEFVHTPRATFMLLETYRNFRIFYTDGRKAPDHPEGTWYGDSIARWDGNVLNVDTINFNDRSWIDKPGHPHSDQMKLNEKMTRTSYDDLKVDITIDDPVMYTAPWGGTKTFTFKPDWQIEDYLCSPSDEAKLFSDVRDKATDKK
jgi:hypothetical protein